MAQKTEWKTRTFRTHFAAQGFANKLNEAGKHIAVVEASGSGWRVAYIAR